MKTLRNFQDELAQERMGVDFISLTNGVKNGSIRIVAFIVFCNDAADRFASHVHEEACKAQKLICLEHAEADTETSTIYPDSILNAPNAPNPFKQ